MFHSRTLNNKINSIYKRALSITFNDRKLSFEELVRKDKTVSIHRRCLEVLAREIFKIKKNMAPEIRKEIFENRKSSHSFRKNSSFYLRQVHSVYHSTESLSFLGPKIWKLVSKDRKQS